jgi:hypothetical protein
VPRTENKAHRTTEQAQSRRRIAETNRVLRETQGQLLTTRVPAAAKTPVKAVKRRVKDEVPKRKEGEVARKDLSLGKQVPKTVQVQKRGMQLKEQETRMETAPKKEQVQKEETRMGRVPKK